MAKILIVDDALFMRKMLADILTKDGHTVIGEAENAKEAVDLCRTLTPDVVTLDIIMPEINGITALQAIRQMATANHGAKVLMVSAMGQQSLVVEAIQAGAKEFIVKPFQPSQVTGAVRRLLRE